MRFIPTRLHGVLDYLTANVLIAVPGPLGVRRDGLERWLPVALGAGAIAYSVLTDYEMGRAKLIPMPVHLALDMASGGLLAASPWLFGFSKQARVPYLALGLFEIAVPAVTRTTPGYAEVRHAR